MSEKNDPAERGTCKTCGGTRRVQRHLYGGPTEECTDCKPPPTPPDLLAVQEYVGKQLEIWKAEKPDSELTAWLEAFKEDWLDTLAPTPPAERGEEAVCDECGGLSWRSDGEPCRCCGGTGRDQPPTPSADPEGTVMVEIQQHWNGQHMVVVVEERATCPWPQRTISVLFKPIMRPSAKGNAVLCLSEPAARALADELNRLAGK